MRHVAARAALRARPDLPGAPTSHLPKSKLAPMRANVHELLASFTAMIDDKVGVIRNVEFVALSERDPQVYLAHAEPADTRPSTGLKARQSWRRLRVDSRPCGLASLWRSP